MLMPKKKGRSQIKKSTKDLMLDMNRDNPLWACRKISDELKKLGIELHHTTVNKTIQTFRFTSSLLHAQCLN